MKNKNEVAVNLLLDCTVLRITREVPGRVTIFLLEHAAGTDAFGKAFKRGWKVLQRKYGALDPSVNPPVAKPYGSTGAWHIVKQGRRGVRNEVEDQRNAEAAGRQLHSATTDRNCY